MTIREITNKIDDALQNIVQHPPKGNRAWTEAVKIAVGDIGTQLGYEILANQVPNRAHFQSEWLFDLTWYQGSNKGILSLPLVLECEWSQHYEDLRHDFEKLLVTNSDLKIMIFEATKEKADELVAQLDSAIRNFHGTDFAETYHICTLLLSAEEYRFQTQSITA